MTWLMALYIALLMVGSTIRYVIDKRREDAHHRKENGL